MQWHTPEVPASWEAEAGEPLEPKSLRPVWATQQDPISKLINDLNLMKNKRQRLFEYVRPLALYMGVIIVFTREGKKHKFFTYANKITDITAKNVFPGPECLDLSPADLGSFLKH